MAIGYDECMAGFEAAKRITPANVEFLMARELMKLLGYVTWDKFEGVIEKARNLPRVQALP